MVSRFFRLFMVAILGVSIFGLGSAFAGEHDYVGSKKCKSCHKVQYKSWLETNMAKALDTLKPGAKADAKKKAGLDPNKDYTGDASCLSCHTTGHGAATGFKSEADTPKLAGVGCESCHGPGKDYKKKKVMKDHDAAVAKGLVIPDEKTCASCHNDKSPTGGAFKFDKNKGIHDHKKKK